jgi:uncharacterized membrane protein
MSKSRLEAFSDGVIAILITIMVLELKVPEGADAASLRPLLPVFLTYVLSFVFLGIYWNNHHHMLHAAERTNGKVLWANLHLLFWLSLVPFVTGWMGANHFEPLPTAVYGVVLFMAAVAFTILARVLVAAQGPRARRRSQGKGLARPLCLGDPPGLREPVDLRRDLRDRRAHLARPRPAHRGGPRALTAAQPDRRCLACSLSSPSTTARVRRSCQTCSAKSAIRASTPTVT